MEQPTPSDEWVQERAIRDLLLREARQVPPYGPLRPAAPEPRRADTGAGDKPISFSAAMVRSILAGNKTQTRRPIRPQPAGQTMHRRRPWPVDEEGRPLACPLAKVGQRLWVGEPYANEGGPRFTYAADLGPAVAKKRLWKPGRFMPRSAGRLMLEVKRVFPQRLMTLTDHDALAEGAPRSLDAEAGAAIAWFRGAWDGLYGKTEAAWTEDPWVWVVCFRVDDPPED